MSRKHARENVIHCRLRDLFAQKECESDEFKIESIQNEIDLLNDELKEIFPEKFK